MTASEYGLDLDGAGVNGHYEDNQLGRTLSSLAGEGLDPSASADVHVARGDFIQLVQLQRAAATDPDDSVAFSLATGADASPSPCLDEADTTCGRHLQRDATFVATAKSYSPLLAKRKDGRITFGPGKLQVTFSLFDDVVTLDLFGARARVDDLEASVLTGTINGAVRHDDVVTILIPTLARYLERVIANECPMLVPPGCGCPPDSTSRTFLGLFDVNPKDCTITVDEIADNSLAVSFTSPDVIIDGELLLSFGFGFEAVPATF